MDLSIATISVLRVFFENQRNLKDQIEYLALKNISDLLVVWPILPQFQKRKNYYSIDKIDKFKCNNNHLFLGYLYNIREVEI